MILVDTSIWIEHLNHDHPGMHELLREDVVLMHPFIIGEIALGSMPDWRKVMYRLRLVRSTRPVADGSVVEMIAGHRLMGSGIGYVDAHLLASCLTDDATYLWTTDRRLGAAARQLGIEANVA